MGVLGGREKVYVEKAYEGFTRKGHREKHPENTLKLLENTLKTKIP